MTDKNFYEIILRRQRISEKIKEAIVNEFKEDNISMSNVNIVPYFEVKEKAVVFTIEIEKK